MVINSEKIGQLIKQPQKVSISYLSDIQTLIDKYPYCSTLYILNLIAYAKSKDAGYEEQLKLAAANVSDKAQLHHLISRVDEEITEEVISSEEEIIEIKQASAEQEIVKTLNIETSKEDAIEATAEFEKEQEKEEDLASLDASILSEVVSTAFDITQEEEKDADNKEKEKVKSKASPHSTNKEKKISSEPIEATSPAQVKRENMTFIEWLKYKKSFIEGNSEVFDVKNTKSKSDQKESIKEANNMSKKEINDLLDKFLEEEPTISAGSKDFFNPSTNAKKSVEESLDIVSETLAKIHVMQGNYSKAISAYKQLCLLYPEKKTFFADQIKLIEEKRNK